MIQGNVDSVRNYLDDDLEFIVKKNIQKLYKNIQVIEGSCNIFCLYEYCKIIQKYRRDTTHHVLMADVNNTGELDRKILVKIITDFSEAERVIYVVIRVRLTSIVSRIDLGSDGRDFVIMPHAEREVGPPGSGRPKRPTPRHRGQDAECRTHYADPRCCLGHPRWRLGHRPDPRCPPGACLACRDHPASPTSRYSFAHPSSQRAPSCPSVSHGTSEKMPPAVAISSPTPANLMPPPCSPGDHPSATFG